VIFLPVACAVLGYLVGSFLPPLVERLAGRELSGVRARPRVARVITALVFGLLAARLGPSPDLPAFLYVGAVGVALAFVDLEVRRLPNSLTYPSYPVAVALLGAAAATLDDGEPLTRALLGMVALYAFYLLLLLIHPAGMGWGDVKLAGVLGLYLGWLGWSAVAVGAYAAFLLAGIVGVGLLAARRAGRRSKLPFGPYMLVGALLALFAATPIVTWYQSLLAPTA